MLLLLLLQQSGDDDDCGTGDTMYDDFTGPDVRLGGVGLDMQSLRTEMEANFEVDESSLKGM
jgi:hypothetical protein